MNRTLWHIGVVFVALGVMLAAVPTGSYSTIAGERSVSVSVAADDSALIALQGTGNTVTSTGQTTHVASLVNNFDSGATVEYETSTGSDALTVETTTGAPTLQSGETEPLSVRCSASSGGGSGTATLNVTVTQVQVSETTITTAELTTTVSYDCPGGGPPSSAPDGSDGYVDTNGNGQYDEGEQTLSASELEDFDDPNASVVINADGGLVDSGNDGIDINAASVTIVDTAVDGKNGDISISAESITMTETTFDAKNSRLSLTSTSGDIDITGTTFLSEHSISITSAGDIHANQSVVESAKSDISLTANGDIFVREAQLTSSGGNTAVSAELGSTASILDVTSLEVSDKDDVFVYGPSGATVVGTPSSGQVST